MFMTQVKGCYSISSQQSLTLVDMKQTALLFMKVNLLYRTYIQSVFRVKLSCTNIECYKFIHRWHHVWYNTYKHLINFLDFTWHCSTVVYTTSKRELLTNFMNPNFLDQFFGPKFFGPKFFGPKFLKPNFLDPNFLDPYFLELNFLNPNFLDPFLDPNFLSQNFWT